MMSSKGDGEQKQSLRSPRALRRAEQEARLEEHVLQGRSFHHLKHRCVTVGAGALNRDL